MKKIIFVFFGFMLVVNCYASQQPQDERMRLKEKMAELKKERDEWRIALGERRNPSFPYEGDSGPMNAALNSLVIAAFNYHKANEQFKLLYS